ncbi:uracil-DNA glycosylase [Bacillus sp. Marseille-P3661]|uniref:uracil-DNA glycosylase n=1 Tax=Bacillus sp. Marseille-P3661 TaxID=1936234 RepID=UPI000C84374D|nr:uracil-DNA glycosylase [Bacillus sp. Marseille-P3661]
MSDFFPVLWPEEPTPERLKACDECGLNEHGTRMIWGEGNPNAPILILLDNPGARENREDQAFVCGTRQTLQQAANHVGLTMNDLYVTYVLKRKPVRAYNKDKTRKICMTHLNEQLQMKQPSLVFCLGNVAVQSFFDNPEATEVKALRGRIHTVHGYSTAVAYHPLAVRRRPNLWSSFIDDWKLIADHYFKHGNN